MRRHLLYSAFFSVMLSCTQNSDQFVPLTIPDHFPKFEIMLKSERAFDGYIFLRKSTSPGAQFMINNAGEIVWYQVSDTALFRPCTPYEKSYIALYNDKEIHEITYDGDTLLKLTYGDEGFDRFLHHEIVKDEEENIVSLTKEILPIDLSEYGGKESDTIKTDGIIKLSKEGKKLWHQFLWYHISFPSGIPFSLAP